MKKLTLNQTKVTDKQLKALEKQYGVIQKVVFKASTVVISF